MSFLTNLKDKAKKLTEQAKKMIPHKALQIKIDVPHQVALNKLTIEWDLDLTAHQDISIRSLHYIIVEQKDPMIGKKKEALETLHDSIYKKKIRLKKDDTKKISLKLPIQFNPTTSDIWAGDLSLMNKMSERSKLTAINFALQITSIYTLPNSTDPKEEHTQSWKHDISFE